MNCLLLFSSPDEHAGASVARRASSLSAMPSKTSIKISSHLLIERFFYIGFIIPVYVTCANQCMVVMDVRISNQDVNINLHFLVYVESNLYQCNAI